MAIIEIDKHSGFCFGVTTAISKAEQELQRTGTLYCLGDIVHNSNEVERLENKGLVTISHDEMAHLSDVKVLLRAHGEPPETYNLAKRNNIDIIDATCPVVLQLQKRINASFNDADPKPQLVIFGKRGHAEVNGLVGQTGGETIVIENIDEIGKIDFSRNICLYSQTTMSVQEFREIVDAISYRIEPGVKFESYDTICRSVANRIPQIRDFASRHEVILFVCGSKSSNGRILFEQCHQANPNSYLISNDGDIEKDWVQGKQSIGICGATSTPMWLMDKVKQRTQILVGDSIEQTDDKA